MSLPFIISNTTIRQDSEGRYCLNDCHAASGGEKKNGPSYWTSTEQAKALVTELTDTGIPVSPILTIKGGNDQGTYVAKELVYAYAMWISPAFHLTVIRAFDAMITNAAPVAAMSREQQLANAFLIANDMLREKDAQIAVLAPKADVADRIAIADGSLSVSEAAKAIQIRPKDLFDYLSHNGWIYKRAGSAHWLGYQSRTNAGDLEHKVTTVLRADGSEKITEQVRVTPRGLSKLAKLVVRAVSAA